MTIQNDHEVLEGVQEQTSTEEWIRGVDTAPWGGTPSNPSAAVWDEADGSVVTSSVFPVNLPSVSGDKVMLSPLKNLTKDHTYRIGITWTSGGNKSECFIRVRCIF